MAIKVFGQLNKNDANIAGGKGASLGEMTQAGIPVPPGFVVLSESFEDFIRETDLNVEIDAALDTVNHQEVNSVEAASAKIQALIIAAEMPQDIAKEIKENFSKLNAKYVAVRSSATAEDSASAAWAGQLDSFLNTTEEELLNNVKKCWASLFTPRAIFYRFEKDLHKTKISVAVVVQKMVDSEISGIAFSVHPVTEDYNQLIIEAGFGLGEAIVSGQITPDSYVVEKEPKNILDINVATQTRGLYRVASGGNEWQTIDEPRVSSQVLSQDQILELSEIILDIEKHYGFPCDIEWAYESGKFYIVQSRPITTLTERTIANNPWLLMRKRYVPSMWPALIYFCWSFKDKIGLSKGVLMNAWKDGWIRFAWKENEVKEIGKYGIDILYENIDSLDIIRNNGTIAGIKALEYVKKFVVNVKSSALEDFYQFFRELEKIYGEFMEKNGVYWLFTQREIESRLNDILSSYSPEEKDEIFKAMSAAEIKSFSAKEEEEFDELVDFVKKHGIDSLKSEKEIKNFSEKYFWFPYEFVGPNIWNVGEVKNLVNVAINSSKTSSTQNVAKLHKEIIKKYNLSIEVQNFFKIFQYVGILQDDRKFITTQISYYLNDVILGEISKRLNIPLDLVRYLDAGLLKEYITDRHQEKLVEILKERSKSVALVQTDDGDHIYSGQELVDFLEKEKINLYDEDITAKEIKGSIANPGKVIGRARVLITSSGVDQFNDGDILVTGMTTPDFIRLIKKSGAIITDEGGITCHAAIISRELDIPCIIGTKHATQILKNGDLVEVDADNGVVKIIKN